MNFLENIFTEKDMELIDIILELKILWKHYYLHFCLLWAGAMAQGQSQPQS